MSTAHSLPPERTRRRVSGLRRQVVADASGGVSTLRAGRSHPGSGSVSWRQAGIGGHGIGSPLVGLLVGVGGGGSLQTKVILFLQKGRLVLPPVLLYTVNACSHRGHFMALQQ